MGDKSNYKDTLNLPRTDFPMKGNLAKLEPAILEQWRELNLSETLSVPKPGQPTFILHDGPPYANGDIHLGHTLNKVLKDMIVRSKVMFGYYSPYVPGWDCHGQPIEHEVEKRLGKDKGRLDKAQIRKLCREYALGFVDRQREQFERLGIGGIWDRPYLTLDPTYEATNVRVFNQLYQEGLIYKGRKPIHWCYRCRTALAEAEIEYADEVSPSIYVKFPIIADFAPLDQYSEPKSLLIWTTTPWTLPANVAVAVHPTADYAAVRDGDSIYVLAAALVPNLSQVLGRELPVLTTFKGAALEGLSCRHPVREALSTVIMADFVALDQGTGCVHIAPGHGEEDHAVGLKYGLPAPMPVDDLGKFTEEAGRFEGLHIKEANPVILDDLKARGLLVWAGEIAHSYPHCWRCKQPVIFRATEQWFVSMSARDLRGRALKAIESVNWVPDWSIRRITGMVSERPDWCISRQRAWGVPIPVFYCSNCGEVLAGATVLEHVERVFAAEGADAWFTMPVAHLLPSGAVCAKCSGSDFTKETDILDVWFESGVSHAAVLELRSELSWPADLYLEGSDQHRGWFQSSLLTSVGMRSAAPFRQVLTHGFLVDGHGRKMSKSLGNVVDPLKVIERSGADILRLWVSSADYSSDIAVSDEILERIGEGYRRIRNTLRFLLGSVADFDHEKDAVDYRELEPIDKWALMRLHELIKKSRAAYEEYKFHIIYHAIYNFCAVDMSSFYLDVLKDRLYTFAPDARQRRSAQTALLKIADSLVKISAPVLAFTAEEAYSYLPKDRFSEPSVHLCRMPEFDPAYVDLNLKEEWDKLRGLRQEVAKALEAARTDKLIGGSLEAKVTIYAPEAALGVLSAYRAELEAIFIVSEVEVVRPGVARPDGVWRSQNLTDLAVLVTRAKGEKCARCWNRRSEVGVNQEYPDLCDRCVMVIAEIGH